MSLTIEYHYESWDEYNLARITGNVRAKTFYDKVWGDENGKNAEHCELLKVIDNNDNLNAIGRMIDTAYAVIKSGYNKDVKKRYRIEITVHSKTFVLNSIDMEMI